MCGIAGILRQDGSSPEDLSRLKAMTQRLAHRGPDDSGHISINGKPSILLGHRRLAVVDLSDAAHQPFADESGQLVLVYNGEVFNYVELRQELRALGFSFRSESDTEVVLRAYQAWGRACVKRFNGMWAFALWDARSRELFCSRDRFGIKPFYYWTDRDQFIFASEVKGVLAGLDGAPAVNGDVLADYLLDGRLCLGVDTLLQGIRRLPAAHNLVVRGSNLSLDRYWNYGERAAPPGGKESFEQFGELLRDAVRLRLRGDVAVGCALSGGLDSASILALASREKNSSLRAFTAVFPGEQYDESAFARIAAESSDISLTEVPDQVDKPFEDLEQVVWALDYPARDGQVLSRWRLMRTAARDVKVMLEGQGADELLAGYAGRYLAPYLFDELGDRLRLCPSAPFSDLFAAVREPIARNARFVAGSLIAEALPARAVPPLRRLWNSDGPLTADFLSRHGNRPDPLHTARFQGRLNDRLHFDHQTGILPMILKMGDALSMAHSVESRLPFLDYRLVEFGFALQRQYKFSGAETKPILRRAMQGVVPDPILRRRDKIGFATPTARWLLKEMESTVRPLLTSRRCLDRGVFDPAKTRRMLKDFTQEHTSRAQTILRAVQTEVWLRLFIDGEGNRL